MLYVSDQLPHEPASAYKHYITYRDAGIARSIAGVAHTNGVTEQYLRNLSSQYAWRERIDAWDHEINKVTANATINAAAETAAETATLIHDSATNLWIKSLSVAHDIIDQIDPAEPTAAQTSVLRAVISGLARSIGPDRDDTTVVVASDSGERQRRISELIAKARS